VLAGRYPFLKGIEVTRYRSFRLRRWKSDHIGPENPKRSPCLWSKIHHAGARTGKDVPVRCSQVMAPVCERSLVEHSVIVRCNVVAPGLSANRLQPWPAPATDPRKAENRVRDGLPVIQA
jgi:hypothetical protein